MQPAYSQLTIPIAMVTDDNWDRLVSVPEIVIEPWPQQTVLHIRTCIPHQPQTDSNWNGRWLVGLELDLLPLVSHFSIDSRGWLYRSGHDHLWSGGVNALWAAWCCSGAVASRLSGIV